jgi:uncharacterized protein YndB with AHSA1/START domain
MGDDTRFAVSRTIDAPADRLFALLADPGQHTRIDGSGLLRGTDSGPLSRVGQVFAMQMHRADLGHYRVLNTVTAFEPGRRLGWAPSLDPDCELAGQIGDMRTGGHTYVYDLLGHGAGTQVTQTYDWSGVQDPQFRAYCPFVTREELRVTLDRLAEAVRAHVGARGAAGGG